MNLGDGAAILRRLGLRGCNSGEELALDIRGGGVVKMCRALRVGYPVKRERAGERRKSRLYSKEKVGGGPMRQARLINDIHVSQKWNGR